MREIQGIRLQRIVQKPPDRAPPEISKRCFTRRPTYPGFTFFRRRRTIISFHARHSFRIIFCARTYDRRIEVPAVCIACITIVTGFGESCTTRATTMPDIPPHTRTENPYISTRRETVVLQIYAQPPSKRKRNTPLPPPSRPSSSVPCSRNLVLAPRSCSLHSRRD